MLKRLRVHPDSRHHRLPAVCLGILFVWFLASSSIQAIPLADYHKDLQRVINALDTLSQNDEEETPADYDRRFAETIAAVRVALPKTQRVQTKAGILSVQNNWIHEELDKLEEASTGRRRVQLFHLLQQIRAVEQRVAELQTPSGKTTDKTAAKDRLNAILSRPEFAPKGKAASALGRLISEFLRWLEKFLPKRTPLAPSQAFSLVRIAQYLVIGFCIVVLIYVLRVFLPVFVRRKKQKDKSKSQARVVLGEHIAADESAKDLLADAEELARSGQLRAAIRKAYIALLVELGDRKVISLAQHKTNRDYLRSVQTAPALYASMNGLTEIFERNWYGLAQPTPTDWQAFRDGYQEALKTRS